MNIDELLTLIPDENRDEATKMLDGLKSQIIRGAIPAVMARNMSHGVGKFLLNEKVQVKLTEQ